MTPGSEYAERMLCNRPGAGCVPYPAINVKSRTKIVEMCPKCGGPYPELRLQRALQAIHRAFRWAHSSGSTPPRA